MALKENEGMSDQFWVNLSSVIKAYLKQLPQDPNYEEIREDH